MKITIIVACDEDYNIGKNGTLPWEHDKEDMIHFKKITCAGKSPATVMGRKTWESLPFVNGLPKRKPYVMSRSIPCDNTLFFNDIPSLLVQAAIDGIDNLCIIGGSPIYDCWAPLASTCYITRIKGVYDDCDVKLNYDGITNNKLLVATMGRIEKWKKIETGW